MKKDGEEINDKEIILEHEHPDFDYDAFFNEDDKNYEEQRNRNKKRRKVINRIIGSILVIVLIVNGLAIWPTIINLPAIEFLNVSAKLSQQETIKDYKKAVVTIERENVKGTGFNINPNGVIITNEHVVGKRKHVLVHFRAGESYTGTVVFKNSDLDIAIVHIEAKQMPSLKLTFENSWQEKDDVIFIGNPLAFTQIVNVGVIIGSTSLSENNQPVMMIQAPIYKGNSGSPVLNGEGKVIGVIFATLQNPRIETNEIIGVATPISYVKDEIKKWGK